jgi:hypothetical protein
MMSLHGGMQVEVDTLMLRQIQVDDMQMYEWGQLVDIRVGESMGMRVIIHEQLQCGLDDTVLTVLMGLTVLTVLTVLMGLTQVVGVEVVIAVIVEVDINTKIFLQK